MLNQTQKVNLQADGNANLTAREREIALLAGRGLRNKAIAREVNVSEGTVKAHLHAIFSKLGIGSRMTLISRYLDTSEAQPFG